MQKKLTVQALALLSFFVIVPLSIADVNDSNNAESLGWLETNELVASDYIVPRYQAFQSSSNILFTNLRDLCLNEASVELNDSVKASFESAYIDWANIQHIKFGPVSFLKRLERIQYWPDKHNVGERQLRKLLISLDDGGDLLLEELQRKSVAVQGLATLERLLYSKDKRLSQSECRLAVLVSENVSSIATELDNNWRLAPVEFAKEFSLAEHGEGTYQSSKDVIGLIAESLVTQLLIIADYKIGRALPQKEGGRVYDRRLEAWRSGLSSTLLASSLDSLYALYQMAFAQRLAKLNAHVNHSINAQFNKVLNMQPNGDPPLSLLVKTDDGLEQLKALQTQIKQLELMIRNDMYPVLEFNARFNSLDGD